MVFLDVDGVLHSLYGDDIFQDSCCEQLERILRTTGASIVLSSTWRMEVQQLSMINAMLQRRALPPISECTEVLNSECGRAEEITRWLDGHPEVTSWVALDDLDLEQGSHIHAQRMSGHFVRTAQEVGLTEKESAQAIEVLTRMSAAHAGNAFCRLSLELQDSAGPSAVGAVLECVHAAGVHLPSLPLQEKCLRLWRDGVPWIFGRVPQADLLARLVPDESVRNCISRQHFELQLDGAGLTLRRCSQYSLLINGEMVGDGIVNVANGSVIGLFIAGMSLPFISFCVYFGEQVGCAESDMKSFVYRKAPVPAASLSPAGALDAAAVATVPSPQRGGGRPPLATRGAPATPAVAPHESSPTASDRCLMSCTYMLGADLSAAPEEKRIDNVELIIGSRAFIGRQHQTFFFEGLMGADHAFWPFISRSHLEITPSAEKAGAFEITNLSLNSVMIDGQALSKGDHIAAELPTDVGFLATTSSGRSEVFLHLRLAPCAVCASTTACSPFSEVSFVETSPSAGLPDALPRKYCLEIGGTAVKQGIDLETRRLHFRGGDLIVGRARQRRLHAEVLCDSVSSWVSRDHFQISPIKEDGGLSVTVLSSNPMWHVRGSRRFLLQAGIPVALASGDTLLLYTGALNGEPDGPDGFGTLQWTFLGGAQN